MRVDIATVAGARRTHAHLPRRPAPPPAAAQVSYELQKTDKGVSAVSVAQENGTPFVRDQTQSNEGGGFAPRTDRARSPRGDRRPREHESRDEQH